MEDEGANLRQNAADARSAGELRRADLAPPSKDGKLDARNGSPSDGDRRATPREKPTGFFFARYGTFVLATPCKAPKKADLQNEVLAALKADNRIGQLEDPPFRPDWVARQTMWPGGESGNVDALLSGDDHFHAVKLSDPISFSVVVPTRNQPLFKGEDDVPTDTYYVAWDGMTAVVLWSRPAKQLLPPRSGGHVVIDVLGEALSGVGLSLYPQACSPGCTNVFAHRVLRIERVPGDEGLGKLVPHGFPVLDTHLHSDGDDLHAAFDLLEAMSYSSDLFARYKNMARRIRDLESMSRFLVDSLLELHHDALLRNRRRIDKRLLATWQARGERRRAREIVSELWLALARIEALKRSWEETRNRFTDYLEERGRDPLYRDDFGDDDKAVRSMDLTFIRAAIEQTAHRQDSRVVALATLAGGVAGGLLGSGLALLLS